ncbi:hypothetical protein B0F90DRAFT_1690973 [Multifurca ochricompacta]|uniref:C3H1-type domain-containing protein n=1 Tax=Multifurca ochricompacta TaxID=376703 RepID=A0AAD4MB12_9AGAM|nr:hypothetical protein B0F90DRAFT_1690973 [Multifurca ochricompacta]
MPGLGPPKTRLCHFFDIQGNRVHKNGEYGCPRTAATCHFIHPSDSEWNGVVSDSVIFGDNKRSGGESSPRRSPPPYYYRHESERRRSVSIGRQRRALSPKRRRRSPSTSSQSPRRNYDDSPPRRYRHGNRSHHDPSSPSHVIRDARPLPRRSPSLDYLPTSKHHNSDRQPDQVSGGPSNLAALRKGTLDRPSEQEAKPTSLPSATAPVMTMSSGATTTTPTLPSSSDPVKVTSQPFQEVLPPPPQILATSNDGLTTEQRQAVWEKRVMLMADATQEYMDLGKLEKDMTSRRRQVQSPAFDTLPPDIKAAFQASLANAETTYERKKASLNNAISRLSETDFWPSVPSQRVGDMEAKLKEARTMLGNLADSVGQLYKRLESLYEQHSGHRSASLPGVGEDITAGHSGDGDIRSKKRRRLSVDGSNDAPPSDVREDVDAIKDTIREIEDHLQEVENDIAQHSRNIVEQLEVKMEEKIEEIARSADVSALLDVQLGPQTSQTIQMFNESFAQADKEITELAQEMAELIPRLDTIQRDNDLFRQEDTTGEKILTQLVKADQDNAEAIARLQEEARALQSALVAQTKRSLPPSLPTPLPGPFMEAIKGSIIKQVHEQILPIVAETRTEIERIAKARDMESADGNMD